MKRIALVVLVLVVLSQMPAAMANENVGVKKGDWFEYSWTHNKNMTDMYCNSEFNTPQNMVVWSKLTVEKVNGTQITVKQETKNQVNEYRTVIQEFDANLESDQAHFNIADHVRDSQISDAFIKRANLTVGDPIKILYFPCPDVNVTCSVYGYDDCRVNETTQRTYLETMEVAHFVINETGKIGFINIDDPNATPYSFYYECNWERKTGVLQEMSYHDNRTEDNFDAELKILIINRGSQSVPEFPTWTPILILAATLTTAAVILHKGLQTWSKTDALTFYGNVPKSKSRL